MLDISIISISTNVMQNVISSLLSLARLTRQCMAASGVIIYESIYSSNSGSE